MIVTRIAPSPTGNLHIGTARSALFNYLFARHHGGTFVVRIEDTDRERSERRFEEDILDNLAWLGLTYDQLYRQSERNTRHQELLKTLIETGKAYISREASKQDPQKEVEVVRLKNPGHTVTFSDLVRGEVTFETAELGDFVIARNTEEPLYHFAVVVDDHDAEISHVIRGEDHISNTPRQILIMEALGWERPEYAHIPLILAPDRSKLSKRKGSVSIAEYRKMGYLPAALINYLALLGWNPGIDDELFDIDELIKVFSIENVQKGGAIFDIKKLNWFNAEHLKRLPQEALLAYVEERIGPHVKDKPQWGRERLLRALPALTERIESPEEFTASAESGALDYYFDTPQYDKDLLLPQSKEGSTSEKDTAAHLNYLIDTLEKLHEDDFSAERIKECVWDYATEEGRGAVLWPMRVALSGAKHSPDPFTLAALFGRDETIKRLKHAAIMVSHDQQEH